MARFPRHVRSRVTAALLRRGRVPGLRTFKTTLAAVLAFVVAEALGTSASPVLAPLTALLVVQVTLYETLTQGLQRVLSVLAGVLVAVGVATVVGLTWWSLAGVIAVALVLGRVLRLGAHLLEVPISAMLVLALGGAEDAATGRVYETLIGAAIGLAVDLLIAAPLYVQPAGDALAELADRMARYARGYADTLRAGWSRATADSWLNQARDLGAEVTRADRIIARTEDAARLNLRSGPVRVAQPRLRAALTGLERCHLSLRELARALLDRTYFVPEVEEAVAYGEEVRHALADILEATADTLDEVGALVAGPVADEPDRPAVTERLAGLEERRNRLAGLLIVDPLVDAAAWEQHGALLTAVDRLRIELEAATRRPDRTWQPAVLTDAQRRRWRRLLAGGRVRRGGRAR